jgi:hypothetical protein
MNMAGFGGGFREKIFGEPRSSGYEPKEVVTQSPLTCPKCGKPCAGTAERKTCASCGFLSVAQQKTTPGVGQGRKSLRTVRRATHNHRRP